jgi:hypothetical protein
LNEPVDRQTFKKSYQLRQYQNKEAQEEIDEYRTNEGNPNRLDGLGLKRGQRR